jgi:hypothetical protein
MITIVVLINNFQGVSDKYLDTHNLNLCVLLIGFS